MFKVFKNDLNSTVKEENTFEKNSWIDIVNPNKEGTYKVTYTVVDNSNFHASKTITVKVISTEMPIITASDREVKQFDDRIGFITVQTFKPYRGWEIFNQSVSFR